MTEKSKIDWFWLAVIVFTICYCIGFLVTLAMGCGECEPAECIDPNKTDYESCLDVCKDMSFTSDKAVCVKDCERVRDGV